MDITAIQHVGSTGTRLATQQAAGTFQSMLDAKLEDEQAVDHAVEQAERTVREAASQFVASAMIQPMLRQAREASLGSDLLDGGRAEKIFGQQLDTIYADEITRGQGFSLVDTLTDRIMRGVRDRASGLLATG